MSDQQMNEVPSPQPQEEGQSARLSAAALPGAALAAQRQKRGWSVEQVAGLVKLSPRQIQAIEADNYSALPGLAVARGFVRSYAKALGLDANALAAAMPQDSPVAQRDHIVPHHSLSTPFSEGPLPAMMKSTRSNGSPLALIVGVVVIVLGVGLAVVRWSELGDNVPQLAWLKAHTAEVSTAPALSSDVDHAAAVTGDAATSTDTPVNARVETITPRADDAAKPAAAAPESAPTPSTVPAQSAPSSAAASAPAAAAAMPSSSDNASSGLHIANSKDLLRLTFREDSWVEIRRADKTTIISRLLKAGTTEAFDVSDATVLVIGNAAGVDATLRGRPLDLKTPGGSNVARVNLN